MIAKGNQRSGGQNLATHLMNAFDNEIVDIAEVRGAIAQDLHGAFAEWHAHSKATQGREYLYSLSVSPDDRQGNLTREQYFDFLNRAEIKLGLSKQARAVVFHSKEGRLHCHAAYSRTDLEKLIFVPLSHDRQKLRAVVQEFARDHGLELPDGLKNDRGKDRHEDRTKEVNLKEKQQQERTGETKAERMAVITEAWRSSDNGIAFVQALKAQGFELACGDRKPVYMVVDRYGEIHGLRQQLEGIKKKQLDERLKDYPLTALPSAEVVQQTIRREREQAARARDERVAEQLREATQELETPPPVDRRRQLEEKQAERRAGLEQRRQALALTHIAEREALADLHAAQNTGVVSERIRRQPKGLTAFLTRITGIRFVIDQLQKQEDRGRIEAQRQESAALQRKHLREQQEIKRRARVLSLVETRERRSLQTTLNRQKIQGIGRERRAAELGTTVEAARAGTGPLSLPKEKIEASRAPTGPLTLPQQQKLKEIKETAREMTARPAAVEKEKEKQKGKGKLRGLFNRMADLFSGEGGKSGDGPKQKQPRKTSTPQRTQEPARTDIDQEALARYLKNLDEEQREMAPEKEPPIERTAELNRPAQPAQSTAAGIDQERLKDALNRAAADKDIEPDKDPDPGRDPGRER